MVVSVGGAHDEVMQIALMVVAGCPHRDAAHALLRGALDDIGLASAAFDVAVVDTQEEAEATGFLGSPSFVVDGRDVFPLPGHPAGLACRVYEQGQPLPGLRDLRRALKEAAAGLVHQ